jgi:hypothetical protein
MFCVHLGSSSKSDTRPNITSTYANSRPGRPNPRTLPPTSIKPITGAAHADHQGSSHPVGRGTNINGEISSVAVPIFRLLLKIAERLISTSRLTQFFRRSRASTPKPRPNHSLPTPNPTTHHHRVTFFGSCLAACKAESCKLNRVSIACSDRRWHAHACPVGARPITGPCCGVRRRRPGPVPNHCDNHTYLSGRSPRSRRRWRGSCTARSPLSLRSLFGCTKCVVRRNNLW